jgi:Ca2+/Na+ antiporter
MTGVLFLVTAAVIVVAGVRLARDGEVIGARSGLGPTEAGVVLLAATTSLPEVVTGFGATRSPRSRTSPSSCDCDVALPRPICPT